jgi:DNA-binding Lrp family transcriptional regulator
LTSGEDNQDISKELKIPLSTIQRRTRKIFEKGLVKGKVIPNYVMLGYKQGLIHVYIKNGEIKPIAAKVAELQGIISVSAHIGNSDVVGEFVYRDSKQILDLIAKIKEIPGVDRTVWSESVYDIPVRKQGREMAFPFTELKNISKEKKV